jgi:GNAT superfamily N-acetyltransferase
MLLIQSEGEGIKADRVTFIPAAKGVEFPACDIVWTASGYRRRGIGMVLLDAMAKYFRVTPGRLAYDLPLSDRGFRLVRRFAGDRFIGATNRMITVAVPLEEESRLAPCHFRRVLDASESDITKMEGHLASLGYEPEPSHRATWAS